MNIIFLDIDGVLNSQKYLISNHDKILRFYKKHGKDINDIELLLQRQMYDISLDKVRILLDVIKKTDAKVVITSSWKKLKIYPYVVMKLIGMGIPIIGETLDNGDNRGYGIKKYILENNVMHYVIIDDDLFDDYDEELMERLVKTSFYDDGLKEEHKGKIIKKILK